MDLIQAQLSILQHLLHRVADLDLKLKGHALFVTHRWLRQQLRYRLSIALQESINEDLRQAAELFAFTDQRLAQLVPWTRVSIHEDIRRSRERLGQRQGMERLELLDVFDRVRHELVRVRRGVQGVLDTVVAMHDGIEAPVGRKRSLSAPAALGQERGVHDVQSFGLVKIWYFGLALLIGTNVWLMLLGGMYRGK